MKTLTLLAALLLGGCAVHPPLTHSCQSVDAHVELLILPSVEAVNELRQRVAPTHLDEFYMGFEYQRANGEYVIVVPAIANQDDKGTLMIWGHELAHVACGAWHGTERE